MVGVGEYIHGTPGRLQTGLRSRIPIGESFILFQDLFDRANGVIGNNWTGASDGNASAPDIFSNSQLRFNIGATAGTSFAYRNLEGYTLAKLTVEIYGVIQTGTWDVARPIIGYGTTTTNLINGSGISLQMVRASNTYKIFEGATEKGSAGIGYNTNDTVYFRFRITPNGAKARVWLNANAEPSTWGIDWVKGSSPTLNGDYLQVCFREDDGAGLALLNEITVTAGIE